MVKNHTGRRPGQKHARIVHKLRLRRQLRCSSGSEVDVEMRPYDTLTFVPEMPTIPLKTTKPPAAPAPSPANKEVAKVTVLKKSVKIVETLKEQEAKAVKKAAAVVEKIDDGLPLLLTDEHAKQHKDDIDRPQKTDEDTDHYLRDLFTPSIESLSATCTQNNIHPKRCGNCHCLLLDSESMSNLKSLFHSDTDPTLNCVSSISDSSLGLRTLFNEAKPILDVDSLTSLGLRSLFDIKSTKSDTTATSYGLRTLFSEGKTESTETMSLHGLFSDTKSETAISSLLAGLFDSNTNVKNIELSDKERKKALIAKDLAHYLNSDDERSSPKSQTMSTFVAQIESLFERYRVAVNMISKLESEIENLKKNNKN